MIIFSVLGPFLAWLISIALLGALTYPAPIFEERWYWPSSFMVCYAFSILPMLLAQWIDRRLSEKWWRSLACFAAGFAIAFALYYGITHEGSGDVDAARFQQYWPYVGLVWGLPAAVCSWVVGLDRKES